jgi:hypothetical protein
MAARVGPAFTGERGVPSNGSYSSRGPGEEGRSDRKTHTRFSNDDKNGAAAGTRWSNESREIQKDVFSTADVPTTLSSHIDEGSFPSPTRGWLHEPDMVLSGMAGMLSQGQGSVGRLDNSLARSVIRDEETVRRRQPVANFSPVFFLALVAIDVEQIVCIHPANTPAALCGLQRLVVSNSFRRAISTTVTSCRCATRQ